MSKKTVRLGVSTPGQALPFSLEFSVAIHERRPAEEMRFVLEHEGIKRPLFWLKVGKDGSFYFGRRLAKGAVPKRGSKQMQGSQASVLYSEGLEFDPGDHPYVSIHSGGIINVGPDRLYRDPLGQLTEQEELCVILFEYPLEYPPTSGRKRDVLVRHAVDKERPLAASIYIAPLDKATPILLRPGAESQTGSLFSFCGLKSVPDLLVQVVLWHGPKGEWPPSTYFTFLHDGSIKPKNR